MEYRKKIEIKVEELRANPLFQEGVNEFYKTTSRLNIPEGDADQILVENFSLIEKIISDEPFMINLALDELEKECVNLKIDAPDKVYNKVEEIKHRNDHLFPQLRMDNYNFF